MSHTIPGKQHVPASLSVHEMEETYQHLRDKTQEAGHKYLALLRAREAEMQREIDDVKDKIEVTEREVQGH